MRELIGWTAIALGTLTACDNFYGSFLRYPIYRLRGWEYDWRPGIGLFGSLLQLVAIGCLWPSVTARLIVGVLLLTDTGGVPWLLLAFLQGHFSGPATDEDQRDSTKP